MEKKSNVAGAKLVQTAIQGKLNRSLSCVVYSVSTRGIDSDWECKNISQIGLSAFNQLNSFFARDLNSIPGIAQAFQAYDAKKETEFSGTKK